ncbi:MAG: helix-turn-helix domain-containing protein [Aldersonia sp.]|nr:helix-turn-helix domain-containing protein [Aldersonia sp.]
MIDTGISGAPQVLVDGRPASTLLGDKSVVAAKLVRHLADHATPCGALPGVQLQSEVTEFALACISLGERMLDGHVTTTEDMGEVRAASARWARAGYPLELVLRILHEGVRKCGALLNVKAGTTDPAPLLEIQRTLFDLLERVTVAATASYLDEVAGTGGRDISADPVDRRAVRSAAGLRANERSDECTIVSLCISGEPAAASPPAAPGRQPAARVQAALVHQLGGTALRSLSPRGATVMLPGTPDREVIARVLEPFTERAAVPLIATMARSRSGTVPLAVQQVHELLALARQVRLSPGLYDMSDLALDYQIARPGAGRVRLAELIQPLERTPELIETLEVHIANDLNRQRTAKKMYVHANTVDYRLKRVAQLTGCDPTRPSGLRRLQAALLARRLEASQRRDRVRPE